MEGSIRIAGTVGESIVDGPGFRYTLFTQGCPHHCPGCHNPQTHDFAGGRDMELEALLRDMCKNPLVKGVTFSGGEPFCQPEPLYRLAVELKKKGKHLMAYSGYTFEELLGLPDPSVKKLLSQLDLLVDGRFIEAERNIELRFRGSETSACWMSPGRLQSKRRSGRSNTVNEENPPEKAGFGLTFRHRRCPQPLLVPASAAGRAHRRYAACPCRGNAC